MKNVEGISLPATIIMNCLWVVIALLLLFAAYTDAQTKKVYRGIWYGIFLAGIGIAVLKRLFFQGAVSVFEIRVWIQWLLFCALQFTLFANKYGKADRYCFCCCAFLLTSVGGKLKTYLFLMLFSYLSLAVVQLFRKNINGRGNLKEPVAFVPYIVGSFLCLLFCMLQKTKVLQILY